LGQFIFIFIRGDRAAPFHDRTQCATCDRLVKIFAFIINYPAMMQRQIIHPASERLESPPQQGYVGDRLVWGTSGKNAY
jgi:hypothetical protein